MPEFDNNVFGLEHNKQNKPIEKPAVTIRKYLTTSIIPNTLLVVLSKQIIT